MTTQPPHARLQLGRFRATSLFSAPRVGSAKASSLFAVVRAFVSPPLSAPARNGSPQCHKAPEWRKSPLSPTAPR